MTRPILPGTTPPPVVDATKAPLEPTDVLVSISPDTDYTDIVMPRPSLFSRPMRFRDFLLGQSGYPLRASLGTSLFTGCVAALACHNLQDFPFLSPLAGMATATTAVATFGISLLHFSRQASGQASESLSDHLSPSSLHLADDFHTVAGELEGAAAHAIQNTPPIDPELLEDPSTNNSEDDVASPAALTETPSSADTLATEFPFPQSFQDCVTLINQFVKRSRWQAIQNDKPGSNALNEKTLEKTNKFFHKALELYLNEALLDGSRKFNLEEIDLFIQKMQANGVLKTNLEGYTALFKEVQKRSHYPIQILSQLHKQCLQKLIVVFEDTSADFPQEIDQIAHLTDLLVVAYNLALTHDKDLQQTLKKLSFKATQSFHKYRYLLRFPQTESFLKALQTALKIQKPEPRARNH